MLEKLSSRTVCPCCGIVRTCSSAGVGAVRCVVHGSGQLMLALSRGAWPITRWACRFDRPERGMHSGRLAQRGLGTLVVLMGACVAQSYMPGIVFLV